MHNIIVSDTSCLILFDNIGALEVLQKTYGEIIITPEVAEEYRRQLPEWIKIKSVLHKNRQREFEQLVDYGEASAIALALELEKSILIIDDKRGRKLAQQMKIELTGTLGTLLKAKQLNVISSIRPFIEKMKMFDYHISRSIEIEILKKVNEL